MGLQNRVGRLGLFCNIFVLSLEEILDKFGFINLITSLNSQSGAIYIISLIYDPQL